MKIRPLIFGLMASAMPVAALAGGVLHFPDGSVRGYEKIQTDSTIGIAIGPYQNGKIKTVQASGTMLREVWTTPIPANETLGLITPLRGQLAQSGYKVVFECDTRSCGGFDFRFNANVLDEPQMHVDLGDFRYLCATRTIAGKKEFVSLLVSRSPDRGFVQMTRVGAPTDPAFALKPAVEVSTKQGLPAPGASVEKALSEGLVADGSAVLNGLVFKKGSATLSGSPAESLRDLAAFLTDNPHKKVILVGHTDASGTLDGNIALSRKRADSVLKQLIKTYGVNPSQVAAQGIGFLAPRATNQTSEGRKKNRRVEVVLTAAN